MKMGVGVEMFETISHLLQQLLYISLVKVKIRHIYLPF